MSGKTKILIIIVIILIGSGVLYFFSVHSQQIGNSQQIDYYGYGDSISAPDDMYVMQMRDIYDLSATADHNTDGSGQMSCWGFDNITSHYNKSIREFIYMFTNDEFHLYTPELTAYCYTRIYTYVSANGTLAVPVLATLRTGNQSEQAQYLQIVGQLLDMEGVPYVKMYDAIDSEPGNGLLDGFNATNYVDGVHPTSAAQRLMADYLWRYIKRGM